MAEAISRLKPMLESPAVLKIAHNAKYDTAILMHSGIRVSPVDDTMLLSFVLDAASTTMALMSCRTACWATKPSRSKKWPGWGSRR